MTKILLLFFSTLPVLAFSQDPRTFNHGTCIVEHENNDNIKYYLTWSSAFNNGWEHDIYNSTIYFDNNGNLITEIQDQVYIGSGNDEAQEPVNAIINTSNNYILSVWEDGIDTDGPNVSGQLHHPDGTTIRSNWIIAGGAGSQHSANTAHLNNKFLIFYADEAPPSTGGAVLKAKVVNDISGIETQTIRFSPNNEDHWWPVSVSNSDNTRTLIIWGNDGYATRGTVLYENAGIIQQTNSPQDYLTNIQQYYYQVEWLENISKFLLVARNGAYDNITNKSQVCLIDTSGNITNSTIVDGGILREAKMAVKWSDCNQSYAVFYPSGINNLTQISIDNNGNIISTSNQITGHSDLTGVQWASTGIWSKFISDINGNETFNNNHIALFIMNDMLSNDIIKIPIHLNTSLFCTPLSVNKITESNLIIYPNPSSYKINLPSEFSISNYEIYSMNGQKLLKGALKENSLNILTLKNGIYLMKIILQETGEQYIFKIIKEN